MEKLGGVVPNFMGATDSFESITSVTVIWVSKSCAKQNSICWELRS